MKVREFCKILDLEECQVNEIRIREYTEETLTFDTLTESALGYGNRYDEYDTVVEWFLADYGDYEIMEGAYVVNGSFRCDLRKDEENGKTL